MIKWTVVGRNKLTTLATVDGQCITLSANHSSLHLCRVAEVVKVDRRIRWHYTTTILRLRIGARLTRYRNCKFHNFARTISRHADGMSRYSVPPSAGPLLPLATFIFFYTSNINQFLHTLLMIVTIETKNDGYTTSNRRCSRSCRQRSPRKSQSQDEKLPELLSA